MWVDQHSKAMWNRRDSHDFYQQSSCSHQHYSYSHITSKILSIFYPISLEESEMSQILSDYRHFLSSINLVNIFLCGWSGDGVYMQQWACLPLLIQCWHKLRHKTALWSLVGRDNHWGLCMQHENICSITCHVSAPCVLSNKITLGSIFAQHVLYDKADSTDVSFLICQSFCHVCLYRPLIDPSLYLQWSLLHGN